MISPSSRRALPPLAALVALAALGCVIRRQPLAIPPRNTAYVAVLSGEMPEPIAAIARHAWIIANPTGEGALHRYELLGHASATTTSDPFDYFGNGDVAVHGILRPEPAAVRKIMACLEEETPRYNEEHPTYFPIPGPNSNTYVDQMLRRCGLPFELPPTAIGKDYRGVIGASVTAGGTGVQLETWLGGVKIGLKEGIELHFLGLSLGVDFYPLALIVPINPGRIGFDDL